MAFIRIHIDDDLKQRSYTELERLGITPSELLRTNTSVRRRPGQVAIQNGATQ